MISTTRQNQLFAFDFSRKHIDVLLHFNYRAMPEFSFLESCAKVSFSNEALDRFSYWNSVTIGKICG